MDELNLTSVLSTLMHDPSTMKLPDPEQVSYYVLENDRKIWIDLSVDAAILEYERLILRWNMEDKGKDINDRKPIRIYLMNYGGDIDAMWSFVDMMNLSKTPIYTINMGQCASAAGIIFMAGDKRIMMPGATVMIHEGSGAFSGDANKVMDHMESYKATIKKMKEFILERTSIEAKMLNKKRTSDWEIDAKFCLENGVCDMIAESLDDII